jgi:hypothetical protein
VPLTWNLVQSLKGVSKFEPQGASFEVAFFVPIPTRSISEGMTYDLNVMIHFRSLADAF